MEAALHPQGGHNISGVTVYNSRGPMKETDLKHLQCPLCDKCLRDPVQVIVCGHRFCKSCLEHFISNNEESTLTCPVDHEPFTQSKVRTDKGCQKELAALKVDCPTKPLLCSWHGPLSEIEAHIGECPNAAIACGFQCGEIIARSQLIFHEQQCPKRLTGCIYCKNPVPKDAMQEHYVNCEDYPVKCDYCSAEIEHRKQYPGHLELVCNEYEMTCPASKVSGCTYKGKRPQVHVHVRECHSVDLIDKLTELTAENKELREEAGRTKSELTDVHRELCTLKSENKELISEVVMLRNSVQRYNTNFSELIERLEKLERTPVDGIRQPRDFVEADGVVDSHRRPTTLTLRGASLTALGHKPVSKADCYDLEKDHGTAARKENQQLALLTKDMDKHKSQVVQMAESVQSLQEMVTRQAVMMDDVRIRQDVLEVRTQNGILIWKIPDVKRRYRDAVDQKTLSIYSPPFYTSPHGYRMCIRAYLNGDGIGKTTHISVFLVLMRSEHDSLLSWPFKQSVKLTLLNQKDPANSFSQAFVPDVHSVSFQRPENEMNIASGFPKFVKQSVLHNENFTLGNALFIKAEVDLTGLS